MGNTTSIPFLTTLLASMILFFVDAAAKAIPCENHWRGDAVLAGGHWRFDIRRAANGVAIVDVPSMWRGNVHLENTFDGDRVTTELPFDLGRLEARVSRCRLEGEIVRQDGARAEISWASSARPEPLREELRLDVNGVTVAATLVRPSGVSPAPLVIVLHGGGDSSRADSPGYVYWGDELSRLGYAVLLYDKRGNGGSSGMWRTVGFEERARDIVAMTNVLEARSDIDASRIGLLAISQGGWVAVRAAQLSPRIKFIATISSPAVTPYEADTYASWISSRKAGLSVQEADERLSLWRSYVGYVRTGRDDDWEALMLRVRAAQMFAWFPRRPFDPEPRDDPFVAWYRRVADFDPALALTELTIPMLWVYGDADTQSDVGRNLSVLTNFRNRSNKPYEIAVLAGGDHGVAVTAPVLGGESTYFASAPGFLDTVESWFQRQTMLR